MERLFAESGGGSAGKKKKKKKKQVTKYPERVPRPPNQKKKPPKKKQKQTQKKKVPVRQHVRRKPLGGDTVVKKHTREITQRTIKEVKPVLKRNIKIAGKVSNYLEDSSKSIEEAQDDLQDARQEHMTTGMMTTDEGFMYINEHEDLDELKVITDEKKVEIDQDIVAYREALDLIETSDKLLSDEEKTVENLDRLIDKIKKADWKQQQKYEDTYQELDTRVRKLKSRTAALKAKGIDTNEMEKKISFMERQQFSAAQELEALAGRFHIETIVE